MRYTNPPHSPYKICIHCHDLLVLGINITPNKLARSEYLCGLCKLIRKGGLPKSLPINQQLAHGMKIYRVKLHQLIKSLTGKVGRPPKILNELHQELKTINKSIKKHSKT